MDLDRPSRDIWLMRMATVVGERSTCSRRNVGAVISKDSRIISMGYNGAPAGMPHCNHSLDDLASSRGCERVVHAEANGIAYAARNGIATQGAQCTVTLAPCANCAKLLINGGISRVVYSREYRDMSGVELLKKAGVETWLL